MADTFSPQQLAYVLAEATSEMILTDPGARLDLPMDQTIRFTDHDDRQRFVTVMLLEGSQTDFDRSVVVPVELPSVDELVARIVEPGELPHVDLTDPAADPLTIAELVERMVGRSGDWIVEVRIVGDRMVALRPDPEDVHFEDGKMLVVVGASEVVHVNPLPVTIYGVELPTGDELAVDIANDHGDGSLDQPWPPDQYTVPEYDFLRRMALALKELTMVHATSDRAKDIDRVLADVRGFYEEDLNEF